MKRTVVATKGALGPGEFTDRVLTLRRRLPELEADALARVRQEQIDREARLLERVPEAQREIAKIQLDAVTKALAGHGPFPEGSNDGG